MPFYDNFAMKDPTSFGVGIASLESKKLLNMILKHKPDSTSILEAGPGRGLFSIYCLQKKIDYTCIDVSRRLLVSLEEVKKKVCGLVPPYPFSENSFDIVYAANLLEHMVDFHAAFQFVDEMRRVAKPGGIICQRVPNAMAWGPHFWNGDYTHSFFTTPRTVSQVYMDAGLKIESIYLVSGPVIGRGARFAGLLGKLIPSLFVDHGGNLSSKLSKAVYSAKTTFLLGLLIVGRKA